MMKGDASQFRGLHRYLMMTLAAVTKNIGMNGLHTAKSPTRAVKEVSDLTGEHATSVPELGVIARSSGPWYFCSLLESQRLSRGGGTRRVDSLEGRHSRI